VYFVRGQLVAAQDEAHLRAVAVGHDHVPALHDHVGDVPARLLDRAYLRRHILMLFVRDQGIAADGDYCGFGGVFGHGYLLGRQVDK